MKVRGLWMTMHERFFNGRKGVSGAGGGGGREMLQLSQGAQVCNVFALWKREKRVWHVEMVGRDGWN